MAVILFWSELMVVVAVVATSAAAVEQLDKAMRAVPPILHLVAVVLEQSARWAVGLGQLLEQLEQAVLELHHQLLGHQYFGRAVAAVLVIIAG